MAARTFALVPIFLAACNSTAVEPDNPFVVERAWGVASAEKEALAVQLADTVEKTLAFYRELPGFEEHPLRIHLVPEVMDGFTGITKVTIRSTAGGSSEVVDAYILISSSGVAFRRGTVGH